MTKKYFSVGDFAIGVIANDRRLLPKAKITKYVLFTGGVLNLTGPSLSFKLVTILVEKLNNEEGKYKCLLGKLRNYISRTQGVVFWSKQNATVPSTFAPI